jgi:glycosyltransferase involved in cell wall biosynthesis
MSKIDFQFAPDGMAGALDASAISPEITIVMPVYNAARHLEATVASVLAQSFAGFELIAIDDGSQDNSLALLLEMAARDPRIKVIARQWRRCQRAQSGRGKRRHAADRLP